MSEQQYALLLTFLDMLTASYYLADSTTENAYMDARNLIGNLLSMHTLKIATQADIDRVYHLLQDSMNHFQLKEKNIYTLVCLSYQAIFQSVK